MRRLLLSLPLLAACQVAGVIGTSPGASGQWGCASDGDCPGGYGFVCADGGVCVIPGSPDGGDGGAAHDGGCCPLAPNGQQDCVPPADCTPFDQCTDVLGGLGYCVPLVSPAGVQHVCQPVGPQSGTGCQPLPSNPNTCEVTPALVAQLCGPGSDCVVGPGGLGLCVQVCRGGGPSCVNNSPCSSLSCVPRIDPVTYQYIGLCMPLKAPDGGLCPPPLPFSG